MSFICAYTRLSSKLTFTWMALLLTSKTVAIRQPKIIASKASFQSLSDRVVWSFYSENLQAYFFEDGGVGVCYNAKQFLVGTA